jgi:nucleoside-diphosphate-sugar epimerase
LSIDYSITETNPVFDTFNFGPSENSLSVREVVQIAKDYYPHFKIPAFDEILQKSYEATTLQLDSTRANSVLGWMPKLTQKQAIISTLSWWNDHLEKDIPAEDLCKKETMRFIQE